MQNNENQPRTGRRAPNPAGPAVAVRAGVVRAGVVRAGVVRAVVVLAAAAGIALLTTACAGGSTSAGDPGSGATAASSAATSPGQRALAYSQCMRSHGVPNYPDPVISGNSISMNVSLSSLGVSQSVLQSAQNDCAKLAPQNYVPPGFNQAKNTAEGIKWAQCIRTHGVPDFPDPGSDGTFDVPAGVNTSGSAFQAAQHACKSLMPMQVQLRGPNGGSGSGVGPGGSS
jgi:hypothetical protein